MAQITFNIPDDQAQRVVDALAWKYGWTDTLGVAKQEFVKQRIAKYLRGLVIQAERDQIAEASAQTEPEIT